MDALELWANQSGDIGEGAQVVDQIGGKKRQNNLLDRQRQHTIGRLVGQPVAPVLCAALWRDNQIKRAMPSDRRSGVHRFTLQRPTNSTDNTTQQNNTTQTIQQLDTQTGAQNKEVETDQTDQ